VFSNTTSRVPAICAWLQDNVGVGAQLSADSRRIGAGDVFLAFQGDSADGRAWIADAVERGAAAVLFEDGDGFLWNDALEVENMGVSGLKSIAGFIAGSWYGRPDDAMFTIAVTGTNGKTSCTQWLGRALSQDGVPTAVVGTLGAGLFVDGEHDGLHETGYTTPDAVMLQRSLAGMAERGAGALAIEASSIGLDQGRLNGMHFDLALFTNFSRDHLDYHLDMNAYEAAKTVLFDWKGLRHAVINLDDPMGPRLIARVIAKNKSRAQPVNLVGYSIGGATAPAGVASVRASEIRSNFAGTVFQLESDFGGAGAAAGAARRTAQVRTRLVGSFNVSNVLGVAGALLCKGIDFATVVDLVEALVAVPGRMQQLGGQEAPLVVIDYAHTPDAIEKTLGVLREVADQRGGRLWCLFGCGGERDPGKRPQMAMAAAAADHVVVTSDNPRGENAAGIIEQIVAGFALPSVTSRAVLQERPHVIEDRAAAILWAVKHARRNDVVLLAGKGHENTQEILGRKKPFLDADHAQLALSARVTMKGAQK
jgi:UDP-N-acetylmuramoyl-L-alanyl-D-glutamate--2,6-diaminopimelate ligase